MTSHVLSVLIAVLIASARIASRPAQDPNAVTVPVHYADQAVVIATSAGVAVVRFTEPIKDGMKYEFRVRLADGSDEKSGEGTVFEKYEEIPATNPTDGVREVRVIDRGSALKVIAADVSLTWSLHTKDSGYLYFSPETERVFVVSVDRLSELDLSRFAR